MVCAIIWVTAQEGVGTPPPRFRTIQVYPKDLRALPGHPEPAVSRHSGFPGGAHARPKTTPVHHAARCGGRVALGGTRAAIDREGSAVGHVTARCTARASRRGAFGTVAGARL